MQTPSSLQASTRNVIWPFPEVPVAIADHVDITIRSLASQVQACIRNTYEQNIDPKE